MMAIVNKNRFWTGVIKICENKFIKNINIKNK